MTKTPIYCTVVFNQRLKKFIAQARVVIMLADILNDSGVTLKSDSIIIAKREIK
jgi:hypothetical protein